MTNPYEWFTELYTRFADYLSGLFGQVLDVLYGIGQYLNPLFWIASMAAWLVEQMPHDYGLDFTPMLELFRGVSGYFRMLDYFVNLPMLVLFFSVCLMIWSGLALFRGWRIIRSSIT